MDQVFAPWRIEWVKRSTPPSEADKCVFCRLPEEGDDREHLIVARSNHAFVLLNNSPYNPGHIMVIPYAHTGEYQTLSEAQLLDHALLKQRAIRALESVFDLDGMNVGLNLGRAAGGSIGDHLHTHIVPRWESDTNYMAVIGETKVIVEALDSTYQHLYDAFAAQDDAIVTEPPDAIRFDQ